MHLRLLIWLAPLLVGISFGMGQAATTCSTVTGCIFGNNTSSGIGVEGTSSSGHGIDGSSTTGFGVVGTTHVNSTSASNAKAGVEGIDSSTNSTKFNSGVYGSSSHGLGINGATVDGVAVKGTQTGFNGGTAVLGVSTYSQYPYHPGGTGVEGDSYFGNGVVGYSAGGTTMHLPLITQVQGGVVGSGPNGVMGKTLGNFGDGGAGVIGIAAGSYTAGIAGYTTSASGDIFQGWSTVNANGSEGIVASIDYAGNEYLAGTLTTHTTPLIRTTSSAGPDVSSYAARSVSPILEDFGKATLRQGTAFVALEPTFASTIDRSNYMVFVTPEGDSHSLYTTQTPGGFQVRESGGGRSSSTFDYRIVAKPLDGRAAARLPEPTIRTCAQAYEKPRRHR